MVEMYYIAVKPYDGTPPTDRDIICSFDKYLNADAYIDKLIEEKDSTKYDRRILTLFEDFKYYYVADWDGQLFYKRVDSNMDGWQTYDEIHSRTLNSFSAKKIAMVCAAYCYKNGILGNLLNVSHSPTEEEKKFFEGDFLRTFGTEIGRVEI